MYYSLKILITRLKIKIWYKYPRKKLKLELYYLLYKFKIFDIIYIMSVLNFTLLFKIRQVIRNRTR